MSTFERPSPLQLLLHVPGLVARDLISAAGPPWAPSSDVDCPGHPLLMLNGGSLRTRGGAVSAHTASPVRACGGGGVRVLLHLGHLEFEVVHVGLDGVHSVLDLCDCSLHRLEVLGDELHVDIVGPFPKFQLNGISANLFHMGVSPSQPRVRSLSNIHPQTGDPVRPPFLVLRAFSCKDEWPPSRCLCPFQIPFSRVFPRPLLIFCEGLYELSTLPLLMLLHGMDCGARRRSASTE